MKEVECVRMGFEIFSWTGYRSGPATTKRRHGIKLFEMSHKKVRCGEAESATWPPLAPNVNGAEE